MLSDVSSLTDISSDDDDTYVPTARRKSTTAAAAAKGKQYMLRNCLRPPRTTTYTAKALYDQIHDGSIDLNPEYQRDIVWQPAKQTGLIDSVLRNYYIPPVIFAVSRSDDGIETKTCIDGKQRLTSIQRFMDGLIPHKDSRTSVKYWYKMNKTSTGKLLPPQYCNQFANKQIVCVEYEGLDDDAEREIFQRVQLGVALSPAEKLQAIPGPWSACIRDVQSRILGDDGFGDNLDWATGRGRDFQCICSIVWLTEKKDNATFPGCPTLEKWLMKVTPPTPKFRQRIEDIFTIFLTLVNDKAYNNAFQRPTRVSPVEFVLAGVFIDRNIGNMSLAQLSNGIGKLREDLRSNYVDIRANTRVMKHGISWMKDKCPKNLKGDGRGDMPAIQAIKTRGSFQNQGSGRRESTSAGKRKRQVPASSDSDSDEEPPPRAKAPAKPVNIAKKSMKLNERAGTSNTAAPAKTSQKTSNQVSSHTKTTFSTRAASTSTSKPSTPVVPAKPLPKDSMREGRRASAMNISTTMQPPAVPGPSHVQTPQVSTPSMPTSNGPPRVQTPQVSTPTTSVLTRPLTINTQSLVTQAPIITSSNAPPSAPPSASASNSYFPSQELDIKPNLAELNASGSTSTPTTATGRSAAWQALRAAKAGTNVATPTTPMAPSPLASASSSTGSMAQMQQHAIGQLQQFMTSASKDPRRISSTSTTALRRASDNGLSISSPVVASPTMNGRPTMLPPTAIPHQLSIPLGRPQVESQHSSGSSTPVLQHPSTAPIAPSNTPLHRLYEPNVPTQQQVVVHQVNQFAMPGQMPSWNSIQLQELAEQMKTMSQAQKSQVLTSMTSILQGDIVVKQEPDVPVSLSPAQWPLTSASTTPQYSNQGFATQQSEAQHAMLLGIQLQNHIYSPALSYPHQTFPMSVCDPKLRNAMFSAPPLRRASGSEGLPPRPASPNGPPLPPQSAPSSEDRRTQRMSISAEPPELLPPSFSRRGDAASNIKMEDIHPHVPSSFVTTGFMGQSQFQTPQQTALPLPSGSVASPIDIRSSPSAASQSGRSPYARSRTRWDNDGDRIRDHGYDRDRSRGSGSGRERSRGSDYDHRRESRGSRRESNGDDNWYERRYESRTEPNTPYSDGDSLRGRLSGPPYPPRGPRNGRSASRRGRGGRGCRGRDRDDDWRTRRQ